MTDEEEPTPLEYARPEVRRKRSPNAAGLLGLFTGLIAPGAVFFCLALLGTSKRVSIAITVLLLIGFLIGSFRLLQQRDTVLNFFQATFCIGALFTALAMSACGFY